ncbi:hypothetical protein ALI144C_07120 [Actinosynnema sp. ALI-1.44]|nr:hypothetical protein ALI144C_07120 [Actinosynnema sp. ALI-1.44]
MLGVVSPVTGNRAAADRPILTDREARLLELRAFGATNAEIARRLSLTSRGLDYNIRQLAKKIGCPASSSAMVAANSLPLREVRDRIQVARAAGTNELWLEQLPQERDSSILAAEFLHTAPSARVGTAILPMYLRHPVATAQLAATMAELSDGRFMLGLGLSNPFVNDYMLGCAQGPPLCVVREYATIVRTLLREGSVEFEGKHFTARIRYDAPLEHDVPVYLAGMRAKMIRLAVELGDGLLLWLCSSRYVRDTVVPAVRQACAEFGKSSADFPIRAVVLVRSDEDRAQAKVNL